ncbi:hypothetical protein JXA88_06105 [Candidatus Fermentibacteria bacterium]|nr:hypothetical protein [Candidatus Fermentibacteria bacterium]
MMCLNGNQYRLCLLDTNALSELLMNPNTWLNYIDTRFGLSGTILTYSTFTLGEIVFRPEILDRYTELFSDFPSAVMDGYETIFEKEVQCYRSKERPNPLLVFPSAQREPRLSPQECLRELIAQAKIREHASRWKEGCGSVLEGILELKRNYPPKGASYTTREIELFNDIASIHQIGLRNMAFARSVTDSGEAIDLGHFPSVVMTTYAVFYKFYPDHRKPQESDVFDLVISSSFPYADYVITEGNLATILRTVQRRHGLFLDVEAITTKDVKREIAGSSKSSRAHRAQQFSG